MPNRKPATSTATPKPDAHPVRDAADALYRAALESCHQHQRLSRVLNHGLDDLELEGVAEVVELSDRIVAQATKRYEAVATNGANGEPDDLWHAANALWAGCREYCRRLEQSDAVASKLKKHGANELNEIRMEYELELSARMALKQAITNYGKLRPEAA
jgi:hypothetical protein